MYCVPSIFVDPREMAMKKQPSSNSYEASILVVEERQQHFFRMCVCVCVCVCVYIYIYDKSLQSYKTLCSPMDCNLPGSSGFSKPRILKWVTMPSSRESSRLRDQTHVSYISCINRQVLYHLCHLEAIYVTYMYICTCICICTCFCYTYICNIYILIYEVYTYLIIII